MIFGPILYLKLGYLHNPTGAPAPAFFYPMAPAPKRLQRPGGVRRGLPIFTREGAMQERW